MTDTVAAASPQVTLKTIEVSAQDLLKEAVSGSAKDTTKEPAKVVENAPPAPSPAGASRRPFSGRVDVRSAALVGAALSLGLAIGSGTTALMVNHGGDAAATLIDLRTEMAAGRGETARIGGEIGRLTGTVTKSGERAGEDAKAIRGDLTQHMARLEQAIAAKIAALTEKQEASDREHAARMVSLGTLIEKKVAASATAPVAVAPQAAKPQVPEPVQTGSIADQKAMIDTKPKSSAVSNWAVREVYDGIAVLEDRKRRLVEVARGDLIPGIGRAEAIERRGRTWVVVTKDGLITPQDW